MKAGFKLPVVAVITAALPALLLAQPDVEWEKHYGDADHELCFDAIQTRDGGFLMAGWNSTQDVATALRLDENGDTLWSEDFDGVGNFKFVDEAADGEFVLVGTTFSNQNWLAWLVKINEDRDILWSRTFSGQIGSLSSVWCVPTDDSGYCLVATDDRWDIYVLRTNDEGRRVWSYNYHWAMFDNVPSSIMQTGEDGFLIAGSCTANNTDYGCLMKIDEDGHEEWYLSAGGASFDDAVEYGDGYLVLGSPLSITVSSEGEIIDTVDFNEGVDDADKITSDVILKLSDGGYAFVSQGVNYPYHYTLARSASDLSRLWTIHDLGPDSPFFWKTLTQTADYGYAIGGYAEYENTDRDFYLCKLGPDPEFGVPRWVFLPDTVFSEDNWLTLDLPYLYEHLADINTPDSALSIAADSGEHIFANFDGNLLTLSAEPDWWGLDSVRLTVADPDSFSSSRYLSVMVTSVNDPPLPFVLLYPPDSSEAINLEMTFVWADADQNPMETDSVQYRLYFRTPDYVYELPLSADRFYFVNDIRDILTALHPGLESPVALEWGVRALDLEDSTDCERDFTLNVNLPQSVARSDLAPFAFSLLPPFPNPFNSRAELIFGLERPGWTTLRVYNYAGQLVASLYDGEAVSGRHEVVWDAGGFPAGIYLCRLESGGRSAAVKLAVVK